MSGFSEKIEDDSFFATSRSMSMGGVFLATVEDNLNFIRSPALVSAVRNPQFFVTRIVPYVGGNIQYLNNILGFSTFDFSSLWTGFDLGQLVNNLTNSDLYGAILNSYPNIAMYGPISLGYVGNGFGILLFSDSKSSLNFKQVVGIPDIYLKSFMEVGFAFGFGTYFDLFKDYTLYVGANVIYTKRYKMPLDGVSVLEILNYYSDTQEKKYRYFTSDSFFANIGMIIDDNSFFRYILNFRNVFGRNFNWSEAVIIDGKENLLRYGIETSYIPTKVDFGIQYYLGKIWEIPSFILSDLVIELNLDDVVNLSEYWFKKVNIGLEISLLKFVKLRGGISEGYPSVGLGLDFYYFAIEAGFASHENGYIPGQIPITALFISTEIKF